MRTHARSILAAVAMIAAPLAAQARSAYLSTFNATYGTANTVLDSCNTCHAGSTSTWNPYGTDVKANIASGISAALAAVEGLDSDGDKYINIDEIHALTLPGDAKSFPTVTAQPAIAVSPTSLAFGTVNVGSSAQQTVKVTNGGTADLVVSSVAPCNGTSNEFTASPTGFTIATHGSQSVTVTYAPVDATTDSGCIAIASNDPASPSVSVTVSGTGQAVANPVVDVDITRVTVAKRLDISRGGTTRPKVSVVNAGTVAGSATVTVDGVDQLGAPVYTASQATLTLAPGATQKVSFPEYVPTVPMTITWTVTVVDADPDVDVATATTKVVP